MKKDDKNSAIDSRRSFVKKLALGSIIAPFTALGKDIFQEQNASDLEISFKHNNSENWSQIKKAFLLDKKRRYFNTAGLGPSPKAVVESLYQSTIMLEKSGEHHHELTHKVHEKLASFLNCDTSELALTRNATEGMNIVARCLNLKDGDEVILTRHEHVGGTMPWLALQKDIRIDIKLVDLNLNGENNLEQIASQVTDKTKVVVFSHVTCTTGMRLPAKEITDYCRSKGIISCIDGAQAFGMIPIDLKEINPNFYVASGHKWLFGPKETGMLFINNNIIKDVSPTFAGAYTNCNYDLNTLKLEYRDTAQREEYGTRNTAVTLALGSAIDFVQSIGIDTILHHGQNLASHFRNGISSLSNVEILTPSSTHYSSCILTFRFKNADNTKLNLKLANDYGLRTRNIYENDLDAIRLSFAVFNNESEVDEIIFAVTEIATSLNI